MQRKNNRSIATLIKMACIIAIVIGSGLTLVSFKAKQAYADFWQQLGINRGDGTDKIKESFLGGYLQYYGARNFKNIAIGDRAATAKDLLTYTRQYVQGDAFKKEYAAYRLRVKPREPGPAKTADQIRKENQESLKRSIVEVEKGLKTVDEKYKKMYEDNLARLNKELKEYDDPNNRIVKIQTDSEQRQYEAYMEEYRQKTKEWEAKFPADQMAFIKMRLQQVLEYTKDVDFNAELVEKYGKKRFVNPAYERKNGNWKYAFRAGKEVTQTVRQFAEQWLKEIK